MLGAAAISLGGLGLLSQHRVRAHSLAATRRAAVESLEQRLDTGDLVYRRGSSPESLVVMAAQGAVDYSHVGVAVRQSRVDVWVVHSEPGTDGNRGGVQRSTLGAFLSPGAAADFGVQRLPGISRAQQEAMAICADALLGLPFDDGFSLKTADRLYCTELAMSVLSAGGVALDPAPRRIASPFGDIEVVTPFELARAAHRSGGYFLQ